MKLRRMQVIAGLRTEGEGPKPRCGPSRSATRSLRQETRSAARGRSRPEGNVRGTDGQGGRGGILRRRWDTQGGIGAPKPRKGNTIMWAEHLAQRAAAVRILAVDRAACATLPGAPVQATLLALVLAPGMLGVARVVLDSDAGCRFGTGPCSRGAGPGCPRLRRLWGGRLVTERSSAGGPPASDWTDADSDTGCRPKEGRHIDGARSHGRRPSEASTDARFR